MPSKVFYKLTLGVFFNVFLAYGVVAQILVPLSTLPNVNDNLQYRSLLPDSLNQKIDNSVFQKGGNLEWDFAELEEGFATEEAYLAPIAGSIADSFPDADMVVDFIGLIGYANRNTTDISILGISGDSIFSLPIPVFGALDNPFIIRRAPFTFNDQFSTSTSFNITSDASLLDSLEEVQAILNQLPGTTVDSVRVTTTIDRSEEVDAWGTITLPSGTKEVVKLTQEDVVMIEIEVYAISFVGSGWIDIEPLLPDEITDLLQFSTVNHLFFGDSQKEVIAEFAMTSDSTLLSVRYASDISSSLFKSTAFENQIDVQLFPNPTSGQIQIAFPNGLQNQETIVRVFNMAGNVVIEKPVVGDESISVATLSSGQYILSIATGSQLLYRAPFVIQ